MTINTGRKLYSYKETYRITYNMFRSRKSFSEAYKKGLVSEALMERIMLAVTQVNGCEICSFAHTKMALEAGLSSGEIEDMLGGTMGDCPTDQLPAIMFAQHYAEYRGRPSRKAWLRLIDIYGQPKAEGILGAIRMIMVGNAYGIPWSSFFNRFRGKGDKRSSLAYELGIIALTPIFMPAAWLKSL